MSVRSLPRAERLLQLLEYLRLHRIPVTAAVLSEKLAVSERTIYRDIQALQMQGAEIEGAAGVGYRLKPGLTLPPLMLTSDELEALQLGARWVLARTGTDLGQAARRALSKIGAVLPAHLRPQFETVRLLLGPHEVQPVADDIVKTLRESLRLERQCQVHYRDRDGVESNRILWPVALGYFAQHTVLVAWCELRSAFRHFRLDRFLSVVLLDTGFPKRRMVLLRAWQAEEGITLLDS